jgi:acyl dehydratase
LLLPHHFDLHEQGARTSELDVPLLDLEHPVCALRLDAAFLHADDIRAEVHLGLQAAVVDPL